MNEVLQKVLIVDSYASEICALFESCRYEVLSGFRQNSQTLLACHQASSRFVGLTRDIMSFITSQGVFGQLIFSTAEVELGFLTVR